MVDVGVRDYDLLDLKIVLANQAEDVFDIVARIDYDRFAVGFVPDYRTVTSQRPDRQDFMDHDDAAVYFCGWAGVMGGCGAVWTGCFVP
jgi:hypothetical protein